VEQADHVSPEGHCPSADDIRQLLSERNKKGNGTTSSFAELSERVKLLRISSSLSEDEVRILKFVARSKLKVDGHRCKEIKDGLELFEELENNGGLSHICVGELLIGIHRFDLVDILARPGTGNSCGKVQHTH